MAGRIPSRRGKREEAEGRKRVRRVIALVLGALVLGAVPVVVFNTRRADLAREAQQVRQARAQSEGIFQQGKELMRRGRYDEAKARFLSLREQDPSYPVKDFIDRADKEAAYQRLLEQASAMLAKDRLGEARDWLAKVPGDTAQFAELHKLRDEVQARARARVRDARAALDSGKREEAVSIANDILKVLPDDRDATSVRTDALAKPGSAPPE